MYAKNVLAVSGALLSVVAAIPMANEKRDVVWVTKVEEEVVTVPVTETVWLQPGSTAPTANSHYGHHHSHSSSASVSSSSEETSSTYVAPSSPSSTSVYVAPTTSSTITSTSTLVYVSPTSSSTSTSVYVAPTTSSTSEYVAPTTSSTPEAPSTTETPTPTTSEAATSTGAGTGSTYTGDITYYDVGLGSCGWTNTDEDAIVALPTGMMAAGNVGNPNNNPYCGQYITISYQGSTHQAKVVDTCGGCSGGSIDLSPAMFTAVAPAGNGRVSGVEWWFSS